MLRKHRKASEKDCNIANRGGAKGASTEGYASKVINQQELQSGVAAFVEAFNRAHFFDAHEVLEDVWRALARDGPRDRPSRRHLQGMVQLAVAFHHESTDNHVGARSVLERAMRNLNGADSSFPDLDLDRLRAELALWRRYLDDSEGALGGRDVRRHAAPALPKIMLRR
jgi:predicted metal-dependent hydrolase